MISQKQIKRDIRLWAGQSYERLLEKALRELDDVFGRWRAGQLNPFELSDKIHGFHDGISRRLYNLSQLPCQENIIAWAVRENVIDLQELPAHIQERIRAYAELFQRSEEILKDDQEPKGKAWFFYGARKNFLKNLMFIC